MIFLTAGFLGQTDEYGRALEGLLIFPPNSYRFLNYTQKRIILKISKYHSEDLKRLF